jgi:hypothetical protein
LLHEKEFNMADHQEAFREPADPTLNPPPESTNAVAGPVPLLALLGVVIVVALAIIAFIALNAA